MGRGELQSFRDFIFNTIDSLVGALDGLDEAGLNWRPAAPATNSLYAIVTHVLGNAEENLLGTLCSRAHERDYPGEWIATGKDADALRARWALLRERFDQAFAALPPDELDRERKHPRRGMLTGRDVLIVVARHTAEHWGEAQLTKSLLSAQRGAAPAK